MKTFLVADTHFGHANIVRFTDSQGNKIRPRESVEEMDADMVELWNDTVKPDDKVYHLGDVVINKKALKTLSLLNGRKVLIKGNHDIFKPQEYLEYFTDIRAYHILDNLILSHVPIHEQSLGRFRGNIHGHTHSNRLQDPRYFCVSVEQTHYKPLEFEYIKHYFDTLRYEN